MSETTERSELASSTVVDLRRDEQPGRRLIYRHSWLVRVTHWINALAIFFLLMTGLNIFNAHPMLYWGHYGANAAEDGHANIINERLRQRT